MEHFARLGRDVQQRWRKAGFRRAAFARLAAEALTAAELHRKVDVRALLAWYAHEGHRVEQLDPHSLFGEPSITVWRNERFVVDVYFWLRPEIAIHDHAFCGAFTVLQGRSLHARYRFDEAEKIAPHLFVGELALTEVAPLEEGDVEPIAEGRELVHRVWHWTYPTVSCAVRTVLKKGITSSNYEGPLAWRRLYQPIEFTKQLRVLGYLATMGDPLRGEVLESLVRHDDPLVALTYLIDYRSMLGDWPDDEVIGRAVKAMRKKHGRWVDAVPRWLEVAATPPPVTADPAERLETALKMTFSDPVQIDAWRKRLAGAGDAASTGESD
ncbi:MAG: hypothetical protein QM723_10035 [Myxococcaceae bacterium]